MGERKANAMLKSLPQTSALCSGCCIIQPEGSAVARFLGQIAEYLAFLLFLLSCYFWLKSPIPLFPHFLYLQLQFEGP